MQLFIQILLEGEELNYFFMRIKLSFLIMLISVGNMWGQCKDDDYNFSLKMASDESFAYALVLYMLSDDIVPKDSLTVYSIYKFNDIDFFPVSWSELRLLSEVDYRSIKETGYHMFLEAILKDANLTVIKASLFEYKQNEIRLLRSFLQKSCLTKDNSLVEYFEATEDTGLTIYFDL